MVKKQQCRQRRIRWSRIRRALTACTVLWCTWGAIPLALAVNHPPEPEKQKPLFQWLFAAVMVGLVCAVAFKNPKRSHQA